MLIADSVQVYCDEMVAARFARCRVVFPMSMGEVARRRILRFGYWMFEDLSGMGMERRNIRLRDDDDDGRMGVRLVDNT